MWVSRLPTAELGLSADAFGERVPAGAVEQAALRGERDAWSSLIAKHERRVVVSVIAAGVPASEARAYANDAWLRLMLQAAAGRLEYLQLPGLVVRQALFLARAAGRRPTAAAPLEAVSSSQEETFFARERLQRARAHVETLPASARRIFLLLYSEPHLSHAEVAARVGLSLQRVRQTICEVRKSLRTDLEEEKPHVAPRP